MKLNHFKGEQAGHGEMDKFNYYIRTDNERGAVLYFCEDSNSDSVMQPGDTHYAKAITEFLGDEGFTLTVIKTYPDGAEHEAGMIPLDTVAATLHEAL